MSPDRSRSRGRAGTVEPDADEAAFVEAFLRAHPGFLADRPDLYRALTPPRRVYGERLADHMAAMLAVERERSAALRDRTEALLAAGRANATIQARAQRAVLAVMAARGAAEALDIIVQDWPALLGVDVVAICAEARTLPLARPLPRGFVARLVPSGTAVALRPQAVETETLYGEAAALVASDALARLPLPKGGEALLACGVRDPGAYEPGQGTDVLAFLAAVAAVALTRSP
jgi:uncharacterized protein YigA (DUF484 family)